MRQALLILLVLILSIPGAASAQTADTLALSVLLFDPPSTDTPRMWVGIKNTGKTALTLCRPSWSYSWVSTDPGVNAGGAARASIHGCGDDDHDPLWILLPGETRLDSYEVNGSADVAAALLVSVEVLLHNSGADLPVRKVLSWKGKVSDALAAAERMRLGKF